MTTQPEAPSDFYELVGKTCSMLLDRKTEKALDSLDALQRERPNAPEILYLMGIAAATMEEYGRALLLIEEAHNLDPDCFEYSETLANLHVRVGNLAEGVYFAKLSTTLEPHPHVRNLIPPDLTDFFQSLENASIPRHLAFGYVTLNRHEYTDAIREFDRHLMLSPNDSQALTLVSKAYQEVGEYERAVHSIQKALEISPDDVACQFQAGALSRAIGAGDAALYHLNKVVETETESSRFLAPALAIAASIPGVETEALGQIKQALDRTVKALPGLPPEASPSRTRKDRIHVGYVANSAWHADIANVLEPILEQHDRTRFDVMMYQQTQGRSAFIQHLNNMADSERRLWELDDDMASIIIGGDEIDILVNMCAPEPDCRSDLFAISPSVIQVGYWGMNFGLEMPGITHVLCDPMTEAPIKSRLGAGQSAEVVRPGLWSIKVPYLLPDVTPLPAAGTGRLTLGAPCELAGLTETAIAAMADVLRALPESRLVFGATGASDAIVERRIKELFVPFDVADRVSVWPHQAVGDPWIPDPRFWQNIDLFLVTGELTSPLCAADALWMGVPVLTLRGDRPLSCTAASILASASNPDWGFDTAGALTATVKAFADDLDSLTAMRSGLRDQVRKTALFNPMVHVREMEDIFTRLVEQREKEAVDA